MASDLLLPAAVLGGSWILFRRKHNAQKTTDNASAQASADAEAVAASRNEFTKAMQQNMYFGEPTQCANVPFGYVEHVELDTDFSGRMHSVPGGGPGGVNIPLRRWWVTYADGAKRPYYGLHPPAFE